ncbi:hypothetical protein BFG52_08170 [Acinetobacter larvae]|uniref:Uncharacterized protein n=2 Tax=Acinetobacter larvae TaxID=1789224 RepID=A0A1B2LZJ2_9GAMM|nr:hypothetical protein BFG52_08170 [Acinetobacter larvae]
MSSFANADDAGPIRTIQALYSHSMEMNKHFRDYDSNNLLAKFATKDLKQLFIADDQLMERTGELGCIEIDLMWLTNGDAEGAELFLEQIDDRHVAVVIGQTEDMESRSLIYQMDCDGAACKINDLIIGGEFSFKQGLAECLSEAE